MDGMIYDLLHLFTYPFIIRAFVVGVLVSLCASMLGVVLVLKRYSLIGHGLSDVGFGALSVAVAFSLPPLYFAAPVVIASSFLIMYLSQSKNVNGDVAIGVFSTLAVSTGVIVTAATKGFNVDVYNYMFGSILAMSDYDVVFSVLLSVCVIAVFVVFYNRLFLITLDEQFAKAIGINVSLYRFIIAFLTSVTVVLGMRMMGTLLISSLIILPSITARRLVGSFKALVIAAGLVSVACFAVGIIISFLFNLPTGAAIVAVNISALGLAVIFGRRR